jgi:hypothetical protein
MEDYLSNQLIGFNKTTPNDYRECWGGVLSFIDDSKVRFAGQKVSFVDLIGLQRSVKVRSMSKQASTAIVPQASSAKFK